MLVNIRSILISFIHLYFIQKNKVYKRDLKYIQKESYRPSNSIQKQPNVFKSHPKIIKKTSKNHPKGKRLCICLP